MISKIHSVLQILGGGGIVLNIGTAPVFRVHTLSASKDKRRGRPRQDLYTEYQKSILENQLKERFGTHPIISKMEEINYINPSARLVFISLTSKR